MEEKEYPGFIIDNYISYQIEISEAPGWVDIRHPRTQAVVDTCVRENYKALIDSWFELPETWDNDRG